MYDDPDILVQWGMCQEWIQTEPKHVMTLNLKTYRFQEWQPVLSTSVSEYTLTFAALVNALESIAPSVRTHCRKPAN